MATTKSEEKNAKEKEVLCGHEEVALTDEEKNAQEKAVLDAKLYRCGAHGVHKLSECQKLCTNPKTLEEEAKDSLEKEGEKEGKRVEK